ncbi:unnamed protein product [Protopolystoma xenopodis]|uniref:Uncharacterized protein n=1 Tax=Protopolystoma xenopodis TaxID=117903 RepID=A0A448XQM4_9PLAT|nr:unnamed protein product [Protopolystoma xenopodis]
MESTCANILIKGSPNDNGYLNNFMSARLSGSLSSHSEHEGAEEGERIFLESAKSCEDSLMSTDLVARVRSHLAYQIAHLVDLEGRGLVHAAAVGGSLDCLRLVLVAAGAIPLIRSGCRLKRLVSMADSVSASDSRGRQPLHLAAASCALATSKTSIDESSSNSAVSRPIYSGIPEDSCDPFAASGNGNTESYFRHSRLTTLPRHFTSKTVTSRNDLLSGSPPLASFVSPSPFFSNSSASSSFCNTSGTNHMSTSGGYGRVNAIDTALNMSLALIKVIFLLSIVFGLLYQYISKSKRFSLN